MAKYHDSRNPVAARTTADRPSSWHNPEQASPDPPDRDSFGRRKCPLYPESRIGKLYASPLRQWPAIGRWEWQRENVALAIRSQKTTVTVSRSRFSTPLASREGPMSQPKAPVARSITADADLHRWDAGGQACSACLHRRTGGLAQQMLPLETFGLPGGRRVRRHRTGQSRCLSTLAVGAAGFLRRDQRDLTVELLANDFRAVLGPCRRSVDSPQ